MLSRLAEVERVTKWSRVNANQILYRILTVLSRWNFLPYFRNVIFNLVLLRFDLQNYALTLSFKR